MLSITEGKSAHIYIVLPQIEKDVSGSLEIPDDALWGAHTQRPSTTSHSPKRPSPSSSPDSPVFLHIQLQQGTFSLAQLDGRPTTRIGAYRN
jgi:hypothetical protein